MGEYFRKFTVVQTFLQKSDRAVFLARSLYPLEGYPELHVIKVFNTPCEPNEFLLHNELLTTCPSIIKIYDSWSDGQKFFMSIEYCEGGDLHTYLEKTKGKTFEFQATLIYCYQVTETVLGMHNLKVCHRDIKPLNIYIKDNFQSFKLGDFGEAKSAVEEPGYHTITGTPFYMSPEQKKSLENRIGFIVNPYRDDIWALGRTFVEISLGRLCPEMYRMGIEDLHSFIERNFRYLGYDEDFSTLLKNMMQEIDNFKISAYEIATELQRIYHKLYSINNVSEPLPEIQEENKESWLGLNVEQIEKEFEELKNENFEHSPIINEAKIENSYNIVADSFIPKLEKNPQEASFRHSLAVGIVGLDSSESSDESSEISDFQTTNYKIEPPKLPPPSHIFPGINSPKNKNPLAESLPKLMNIEEVRPSIIEIEYNTEAPKKLPSNLEKIGLGSNLNSESKISRANPKSEPQPVQNLNQREEKKTVFCSSCELKIEGSYCEMPCNHIYHSDCIKKIYEKDLIKMEHKREEFTCNICKKAIKFEFFVRCSFLDPKAQMNISLQIYSQTRFTCPGCGNETRFYMIGKKFKARNKKCENCKTNYCAYCGVKGGHRVFCDLLRGFKRQNLNMSDFIKAK